MFAGTIECLSRIFVWEFGERVRYFSAIIPVLRSTYNYGRGVRVTIGCCSYGDYWLLLVRSSLDAPRSTTSPYARARPTWTPNRALNSRSISEHFQKLPSTITSERRRRRGPRGRDRRFPEFGGPGEVFPRGHETASVDGKGRFRPGGQRRRGARQDFLTCRHFLIVLLAHVV